MAATILASELKECGIDGISVESRGLVVLFPEPYNPKSVAVAARHGIIIPNNHATQILETDFGKNTLVLVMNQPMKAKVYATFEQAINVYTIGEFTGDIDADVQDPYGKGVEEYEKCFLQLKDMAKKAVGRILEAKSDMANEQNS
jgi:protein-tyrosine-phosphatase